MPSAETSIRAFVAVEIPDEVRAIAIRLQAFLREAGADVSFSDPARMHLTVLFLGTTPTERLAEVCGAMDRAAVGLAPIHLSFRGLGLFGPPHRPRVLWAGVDGEVASLENFRKRFLAHISEPWFTNDQDAFRPHLTLGRIRSGRGLDGLTVRVASHREMAFGGSVVRRILLMRSDLDRPRPQYTVLHETTIKGA